jgi:hypothetical protein
VRKVGSQNRKCQFNHIQSLLLRTSLGGIVAL